MAKVGIPDAVHAVSEVKARVFSDGEFIEQAKIRQALEVDGGQSTKVEAGYQETHTAVEALKIPSPIDSEETI